MLHIRTLAGLSVEKVDGGARPTSQPRRLAMLALIARAGGRGVTRDKLLALLWPDSDEESSRRTLTQGLYALRRDLGAEELFLGLQELRLNPEVAQCDVVEFEAALAAGELERAATLYGGPFLDGFRLSGAADFERWVEEERTALAHRYADLLETLARRASEADDARGAVAWWRKRASLDPLNTHVAVQLMQALVAAGDRRGALQHARIYEALMEQELELPPDREVLELAEQIRSEAPTAAAVRAAPRPAAPSAETRADAPPVLEEAEGAQEAESDHGRLPAGSAPGGPPSVDGPSFEPIVGSPMGPPAPPSPEAAPLRRSRRFVSVVAATLFLALIAGGTGAWVVTGRTGGLVAAGRLAADERLLLADFASPSGDVELAEVATEALRVDLSQSRLFTLMEAPQVRAALRRMEQPAGVALDAELAREVARREGVRALIAGEVRRAGSSYLFTASVLAAESGEVLTAVRQTARDSTEIIQAVDRLSSALRSRVGESFRQVRSTEPLEQVTTSSLVALRLLTQGNRAFFVDADYPRAIALLEQAVAEDTAFAAAYRALAASYANMGSNQAKRVEALTRAYRHRDRLTARERHSVGAAYNQLVGQSERAASEYLAAIELAPRHGATLSALYTNLGTVYASQRDDTRAEAAYRSAIAADSVGNHAAYMNLQRALVKQGRLGEARTVIEEMGERFPNAPVVPIARAALAALLGNYAAAEADLRALREAQRGSSVWRHGSNRMLAGLAALRGRLQEAEGYLQEAASSSEQNEDFANYLIANLEMGMLDMALRRDTAAAVRRVDAALRRHPLETLPDGGRPYLAVALFFALADQPARARALIASYEASEPRELQQGAQRVASLTRGALALAESRLDDAIVALRHADTHHCTICPLPILGTVFERAARPDSAIAVYERFLAETWPDRAALWPTGAWLVEGDAFWKAGVHERLAVLYRERDRRAAAKHYRSIADLWVDGDPELQPRVTEAGRLAALLEGS